MLGLKSQDKKGKTQRISRKKWCSTGIRIDDEAFCSYYSHCLQTSAKKLAFRHLACKQVTQFEPATDSQTEQQPVF